MDIGDIIATAAITTGLTCLIITAHYSRKGYNAAKEIKEKMESLKTL